MDWQTHIDWQTIEQIPHCVTLPAESAQLWKGLFHGKGAYTPASVREWKVKLDSDAGLQPATLFIDPAVEEYQVLDQVYAFPHVTAPPLPPEPVLSQLLAAAMTTPIPGLLVQSALARLITEQSSGAGLVVLLVFDGLAYAETLDWRFTAADNAPTWCFRNQPCLVDGRTVTESAMPRIVSAPSLAHRLFPKGYKERVGFTYWERETNDLTDQMFVEFAPNQVHRVSEFAEILEHLGQRPLTSATYIQIVRNGLDQYCHGHRERPQIKSLLQDLEAAVHDLMAVLANRRQIVHLYVTADHGILWHDGQAINALASGSQPARYVAGEIEESPASTVIVKERQQAYTALVGPNTLTRKRRINEWGFHGGVSACESLVPFIELTFYP